MRPLCRPHVAVTSNPLSKCVPPAVASPSLLRSRTKCSAVAAGNPVPLQRRNIGLYPGNARTRLATTASAAFGTTIRPGAGNRALKRGGGQYIHAGAYRRGSTLVVCATLAGIEGSTALETLLDTEIDPEANLVKGVLENGLRYVILPNKLPPKRFEAHLEIHAGSVDEMEYERGVAHFVEHVTFLGSKKRESLLGTGARANAYTDFHHTVFHVHAPVVNSVTGQQMLPQVLEALEEIAFKPEFLGSRIEKERKAVIAEAQMMNTIEYRVDCQLLQYLHEENNLGYRFPIGLMEQVKAWEHDRLKDFWKKWYFPANATLFVVGDLDRDTTHELINKAFGKLPAAVEGPPIKRGKESNGPPPVLKKKHEVRPPVVHNHGFGPLAPGEGPAKISIFRHPLLQHYMLSIFCKLPVQPMTTMGHMRQLIMTRIIVSVFQFRVNARYVEADPPFMSISMDISDSGREGCSVSALTITSAPPDWKGATSVAMQEVRRMQRHGLTKGELDRYRTAILRDSSLLAEQANKIPSLDTLNFVMESIASGHTVMGHKDSHVAMKSVAETITLEDINALASSMLTFSSDYGNEAAMLKEAADPANVNAFSYLGPTRATSLIACIPAYIDETGASITEGANVRLGANMSAAMGAGGHLDADALDLEQLEREAAALDEFDVPEGAMRFDISAAEIAEVLSDQSLDVHAPTDVELPEVLIAPEEIDALVEERKPAFVALNGDESAPVPPRVETYSQVVQRRLSNGIRINYRKTDNEPNGCLLRIICNGGRASEKMETAPDGFGAVVVGTRVLSESGCVGQWDRAQVEVFCVSNLINSALEADEENIVMDFHSTVSEGGMDAMFQMLHLFLESPVWDEAATERGKQAFVAASKSVGKSLERATSDRIMSTMMGGLERRFREPTPEEIDALTLEGMKAAVMSLLHTGNMEANIVGDFDYDELDECLLRYLGTVKRRPEAAPVEQLLLSSAPIRFFDPPREERHAVWHLQDSDERACAFMAGPAPARWGSFGDESPLEPIEGPILPPILFVPASASKADRDLAVQRRRQHPLYCSVTLMLLMEIINSRLFTTVRDTLGLTYDVSFEVTMLDRIRSGWFSVHVTSHPDKIYDALNASVAVLRDVRYSPVNRREVARAKTTLLTRHDSDMKDNMYWLGLITHLQNDMVPQKEVTCLRDLKTMFEAATADDVNDCYNFFEFGDDKLFTCVGTSGRNPPPRPDFSLSKVAALLGVDEDELEQSANIRSTESFNPMSMFNSILSAAQSLKMKADNKGDSKGRKLEGGQK